MSSGNPKNRIQDILAFSRELHDELLAHDPLPSNLSDETIRSLDKYTTHLPLFESTPSVSSRRQLDSEGVSLWNTCAQSERSSSDKYTCKAKAFAYGMIEAAGRNNERGIVRIIEIALIAIRECIECNLLDISRQIVEIAALQLNTLEKLKIQPDQTKTQSLLIQYYMLRIRLACSQERSDIAEHLYLQVPNPNNTADQSIIMETSYRLGELAFSASRYDLAVRWTERALAAWEASTKEAPESNLQSNQKFLILHQLVRANIYCDDETSQDSLRRAADVLKTEYGTTYLSLILQLEILLREERPAWREYVQENAVLRAAIDSTDSKSAHPKLLLRYIQKLRRYNSNAFLEGLKKLFINNVSPFNNREWAEHALLNLFWALSDLKHSDCAIDKIQELFHTLKDLAIDGISEPAAHAILIVIWKHVDALILADESHIAAKWCRLILGEPLFRISSDNQAKLLRKMIVCSLNILDSTGVYDMFNQLPEDRKKDPSTLYLMYKLAVHDKSSLEHKYFELLCDSGNDGFIYLVACTSDALRGDNHDLAVRALEQILSKYDDCPSQRPVVASLCQQVLCRLADTLHSRDEASNILKQVFSILEAVAKLEQGNLLSSIGLSWLTRKIYLCSLKEHKRLEPELVIHLLDFCIKFIELWRKDPSAVEEVPRIHQHYLDIDFLRAITAVSHARKQTALSAQQQTLYTKTLESTQRFRAIIQSISIPASGEENSNNAHKHRLILSFGLEASLLLGTWTSAAETIRESAPILNDTLASILLDCILRSSNASHANVAQLVKLLLRTLHTSPSLCANPPLAQAILPRYLHILFQLALDAKDDCLAESVLDETLSMSQRGADTLSWYPADEIQWLATMAFNHAIDLYIALADEDSRRWAQKAIALADSGDDGERKLGRLLRVKYEKLA